MGEPRSYAKGDTMRMRSQPVGTPANTPRFTLVAEFQSDTANEGILLGGSSSLSSTQKWLPIAGTLAASGTESLTYTMFPLAATLAGVSVNLSAAPGTGNTRTFTLRKTSGGSTSSVGTAITYGAAESGVKHQAESISVAAGDMLSIQSDVTGTPAAALLGVGIVYNPTTDGQFVIPLAASAGQLSTSAARYVPPSSSNNTPTATEANTQQVMMTDFSLRGWTAWLDASPGGSGKKYTPELRLNVGAAGTTYATDMTTQGPTTSASTNYVIPADWDLLDTLVTPASTPTAARITISYVGYIAP